LKDIDPSSTHPLRWFEYPIMRKNDHNNLPFWGEKIDDGSDLRRIFSEGI